MQEVPIGGGVLAGAVGAWAAPGTDGTREAVLGMLSLVFLAPVERVVVSVAFMVILFLLLCMWGH